MKVLLSILREMADIPSDPDIVATALNQLGLAVESVDVVGTPVPGVVTARIVRTEKHPDAEEGNEHREAGSSGAKRCSNARSKHTADSKDQQALIQGAYLPSQVCGCG